MIIVSCRVFTFEQKPLINNAVSVVALGYDLILKPNATTETAASADNNITDQINMWL